MSCCLILASEVLTVEKLKDLNNILDKLDNLEPKLSIDDPRLIIVEPKKVLNGEVVSAYEYVLHRIENYAQSNGSTIQINELNIIVNDDISVNPENLNAIEDEGGWGNLLAMLILANPEIQWYFRNIKLDSYSKEENYPLVVRKIDEDKLPPLRDPLLDPTVLRNFVREKSGVLTLRNNRAAAIDEESNYALFHAYTAYRFGFLAEPVRSWSQMKHLFGEKDPSSPHGFQLLFEDVNLSFPDKHADIHLSTFECDYKDVNGKKQKGRASNCPKLIDNQKIENSDFRIIVTGGHSGADADTMKDNLKFIEGYKGREKSGYVLKPVGGMFDLWTQAKLFKRLPRRRDEDGHLLQQGHAPGFYWPPLPTDTADESGGHSAPGKLMLIAQHLVRRADALRDSANTVEKCIRGAVLATDALELLRYQTPTLALQALCLKHEFEVKAEVAFLGVGNNFDLKLRFEELENEVKSASRYFQKDHRVAAELDTLVSIGNRMMLVFRNAGQFDEELACLARIRRWQRKLRLKRAQNPLGYFAQMFMAYAEWLLESPSRFIYALTTWFVVLWGFWCCAAFYGHGKIEAIASASSAWNSFVAANPGEAKQFPDLVLNMLASSAGVFHLGIFISYLYSAISRK